MKLILSYIFACFLLLRKLFYKLGVFKTHVFSIPVVSVGNIEMGGTGKTPCIIYLSKWLTRKKINHVVVSRGYKKQSKGLSLVSNKSELLINNPELCGDEPLLIAKKCVSVPVVACSNKVHAIKYAIKQFCPQLILLDDAFQSLYIKNDLNIVLINSTRPATFFHLYPLGFLRENLNSLKRADIVIFSKNSQQQKSFSLIENKIISKYNKPTLKASLSHSLLKYKNQKLMVVNKKIIEPVVLLSGIVDAESFKQLALLHCSEISAVLEFSDHVKYSKNDTIKNSLQKNINIKSSLITTMKDFVKLEFLLKNEYSFVLTAFVNIYIIDINFKTNQNKNQLSILLNQLIIPRRI